MTTISEVFEVKQRNLVYPLEDPNIMAKIEDMAGKDNRKKAKENYKNEFREKRIKYHVERYKIDEEFKLALFKEYDVENNPKREKAFSMAWEAGHAEGYTNVENHFSEFVELIK